MRGEFITHRPVPVSLFGSPPHAWGIRGQAINEHPGIRFTPTCVGNSCCRSSSRYRGPVHPHMRGEFASRSERQSLPAGSPPHAWGIHEDGHYDRLHVRFTPTCVGNSFPRYMVAKLNYGSPPHAWGIRCWSKECGRNSRFTPTCVGNSLGVSSGRRTLAVHPHMRGEFAGVAPGAAGLTGSPPHAWGIRSSKGLGCGCPSVHPHMRGEFPRMNDDLL